MTVVTELEMGTQGVHMNWALPWWVHWACRAGTRDFCPAGCPSRPSSKYFFLTVHYFNSFVTWTNKRGRQPCWVACLLVQGADDKLGQFLD
jgi:hypothetical protein